MLSYVLLSPLILLIEFILAGALTQSLGNQCHCGAPGRRLKPVSSVCRLLSPAVPDY